MPILSLYIQGKKARRVFSIAGNMHTISLLHINNLIYNGIYIRLYSPH
ncbi:hypothetical protein HMPREF2534_00312 [Bacteroides thetaiotaomicron]|nr:hypothetical protein HMPREF2534_00312 [Bacteroides thetaiotaomicron]